MKSVSSFWGRFGLISGVVFVAYFAGLFLGVYDAAEARIKLRGETAKAAHVAAAAARNQ